MPSSSAVLDQLTDILVSVVGCAPEDVVPEAVLLDLGTDSLAIVEVSEELGRRFGIHLSDDAIDSMVTVKDAIDAVVRHDGSQPPRGAVTVPASLGAAAPTPTDEVTTVHEDDPDRRRGKAASFALWFVLIGTVIGVVLGLGGSALVSATGIDQVDLPPISAPTTPEPTPTESSATPTAPTTTTGVPEPTIKVSSTQVSPGEKFTLTGAFPGSDTGEKLQVEVRDEGGAWDDFPITPETRDGGAFKTELYTSRTGSREFRVTNTETDVSTPSVKVEIG